MTEPDDDAERTAASLAGHLGGLTFADEPTDAVTALVVDAVVAWGRSHGWRVYRRAASVVPLPPPYEQRHSVVDVACARPDARPVVVEIDHTDRRRTVDKLVAEAAAGRVAVWVRWGSGPVKAPPAPVCLVTLDVVSRRGGVHSRLPEREAPRHSVAGGEAEPVELPLD